MQLLKLVCSILLLIFTPKSQTCGAGSQEADAIKQESLLQDEDELWCLR
jgi:hypothetical protein